MTPSDSFDFGETVRGLTSGQRFVRRFVLNRILGRGGFGVVWLAQDEELSCAVAIKFLSEMIVNNPEAVADLKRETRHSLEPHAPAHRADLGFIQGPRIAAIAMEYVDGGTLSAIKAERPQRRFDAEDLVVSSPS